MMLLLQLITITSILVLGYTIVTGEGMALYSIREWAEKKRNTGHGWAEPIFICHWCMPSTWSLLGFVFAYGMGMITRLEWKLLFYYPLTVGGSSLIVGLIWAWHQKINAETDYYESCGDLDTDIQKYLKGFDDFNIKDN